MRHRSFKLECTPDTFEPRGSEAKRLRVVAADASDLARCIRLWSEVGAGFWTERSRWGEARWRKHLRRPNVTFWIALIFGEEAGCFELTRMARGARIDGFGMLPCYRGRGLGRELLSVATHQAFATGAHKVWLHTATDDHPHALPNYLSGGFRIVHERELKNPV